MVVTCSQARYISTAAAVVLSGVILSGPVAVALVETIAPQPPWKDPATFVQHYSWLQSLPYVFGFLIAGGFIFLMAGLAGTGDERQRPMERIALGLTCVSASLIFLNYVMQIGVIPLWLHRSEAVVSTLTMANPESIGWALEMYGYALLGLATACIAPLFAPRGRPGLIRILLVANCILSVAGAMLVPIVPGWVLSPSGMIAGAAWNVLVMLIMMLIILEFKFGRAFAGNHTSLSA
jgi:hypothetical protein